MIRLRIALFLFLAATASLLAQQPCDPPVLSGAGAGNIFTPQLEMDLGDLLGATVPLHFRMVDDAALSAYLQDVGDRLVRQLPPSGIRFQFFIIDLPTANAVALPGGRVYVSRKLIAFLHDEDELAGVLAHEMGHVVTHQGAA